MSWQDAIAAAKKNPLDLSALTPDAVGAAFTGGLTEAEVVALSEALGLVVDRADARKKTNELLGVALQFVGAVIPGLLSGGGIPAALGALFGGKKA
jgi:hypothetical protein